MSSHVLDLSGQREVSLTLNSPSVTKMWAPAKPGDDVEFSFSGGEVRIALGTNAKIQKRIVPVKRMRHADGKPVKENGEYVYDDATEERLVLVLSGSASGFIRSSLTPDVRALPDGEGKPTYEQHTHTQVIARRKGDEDWHFTEAGEVEMEVSLQDVSDQLLERSPDVG